MLGMIRYKHDSYNYYTFGLCGCGHIGLHLDGGLCSACSSQIERHDGGIAVYVI